jgi:hypothetical protein
MPGTAVGAGSSRGMSVWRADRSSAIARVSLPFCRAATARQGCACTTPCPLPARASPPRAIRAIRAMSAARHRVGRAPARSERRLQPAAASVHRGRATTPCATRRCPPAVGPWLAGVGAAPARARQRQLAHRLGKPVPGGADHAAPHPRPIAVTPPAGSGLAAVRPHQPDPRCLAPWLRTPCAGAGSAPRLAPGGGPHAPGAGRNLQLSRRVHFRPSHHPTVRRGVTSAPHDGHLG